MANPTIVLVHGAFADASSWRPVFDTLEHDGHDHTILAPPNPLRGVENDAAYTSSVIDQLDGPILLVGHSYGGAVITVAGSSPKVAGLVFVAGFAPDAGESLKQLGGRFPAPPAEQYFRQAPLPGGVDVYIDPAGFHEVFAADLPADVAAFMAASQRPISGAVFDETASSAAWKEKPSWGVLGTADGAINPDLHRFDYDRAGAKVTEVERASHVVMLSHPDVVSGVICEAAGAIASDQVGAGS
jgi:pimeloyl-ACP methyl ester carboxylesterase